MKHLMPEIADALGHAIGQWTELRNASDKVAIADAAALLARFAGHIHVMAREIADAAENGETQ